MGLSLKMSKDSEFTRFQSVNSSLHWINAFFLSSDSNCGLNMCTLRLLVPLYSQDKINCSSNGVNASSTVLRVSPLITFLFCKKYVQGMTKQQNADTCQFCNRQDINLFAYVFDDVTCIYHHKICQVYNVKYQLFPITKSIALTLPPLHNQNKYREDSTMNRGRMSR